MSKRTAMNKTLRALGKLSNKIQEQQNGSLNELESILNAFWHNESSTEDEKQKTRNRHALLSVAEDLRARATRESWEALEIAMGLMLDEIYEPEVRQKAGPESRFGAVDAASGDVRSQEATT